MPTPDKQREPVLHKDDYYMTTQEIAKELGMTNSAVKQVIMKALRKIRIQIKEVNDGR